MKQVDKIKKLEGLSYFDRNAISQYIEVKPNSFSQNINRWINKGILIQLKKGFYVTSKYYEVNKNNKTYIEFIANRLRMPSYLSLEYVLQKYSMLSESVFAVTSITVKTGRTYRNDLGNFVYRNIKKDLFSGFDITEKDGFIIKEATKVKALFDWLYLRLIRVQDINADFLRSFRLNLELLKKKDIEEFTDYCIKAGIRKYVVLADIVKKVWKEE